MDKSQIEERIKAILADDRLTYKTASVFENAPLALVQLSLTTELNTLERVLGLPLTNVEKLRHEKHGK